MSLNSRLLLKKMNCMVNTYDLNQFLKKRFSKFEKLFCFLASKESSTPCLLSFLSYYTAFNFSGLISIKLKSNFFVSVPYKLRTEHAYQAVFINKL